jgi:hypothetical protein
MTAGMVRFLDMAAGRPTLFTTPEELQRKVDFYFKITQRPTLSGLAYELGMCRQTLYNYEKKDEFLDIIKRAKERVEMSYEERLIYDGSPTGVIFALKNMGWKDSQNIDHSGEIKLPTLSVEIVKPNEG